MNGYIFYCLDLFQSTPSKWRETASSFCSPNSHTISIHSLQVEGDFTKIVIFFTVYDFNPLPPSGGRPKDPACTITIINFNPLPPSGGRLSLIYRSVFATVISIHSLQVEGDSLYNSFKSIFILFQSTPSKWRETFCLH